MRTPTCYGNYGCRPRCLGACEFIQECRPDSETTDPNSDSDELEFEVIDDEDDDEEEEFSMKLQGPVSQSRSCILSDPPVMRTDKEGEGAMSHLRTLRAVRRDIGTGIGSSLGDFPLDMLGCPRSNIYGTKQCG